MVGGDLSKGKGRVKIRKSDLFEFPILSFELVVFFADFSGVFGVLQGGRREWLVRRYGGGTHDDVSVGGGRWGEHWGGSAGH